MRHFFLVIGMTLTLSSCIQGESGGSQLKDEEVSYGERSGTAASITQK